MRNTHPAMSRQARLLISVGLLVFSVQLGSGCSRKPEGKAPPEPVAVTPADADLVLALLPERNVFEQKVKYLPLQAYLSHELGLKVYFKLLDNYEHIFDEIMNDKVDGGFWGSMNGAIAQARGGVEMLARPVWQDESSTYWGYVFTLVENGIEPDPRTWRGRSIAFVNRATTAGFLYPMSLLRASGIAANPVDFFSKAIFAGSHDAAIIAVLQGEVDMGACKNTIYREFMDRNPELAPRFAVLSASPEVPSNGLGVSASLDENLKRRLKEVLTGMHLSQEGKQALAEFGALRFIATSFEDYAPVIEMARAADIDLKEWPLRDVRASRPYR